MTQTILGAGGAIGTALAKELTSYTDQIKLVSRNPKKVNPSDILFAADLTKEENIYEAIRGSDIVYVTIGFPYSIKIWKKHWPTMMDAVIKACLEHDARLVFFDNIYAIGRDNMGHITEESPISPTSKKGMIRAEIDQRILDNIRDNNLKAIIARSPDFFGGTSYAGSILINLVYDRFIKGKKAQWFCDAEKVHTFGYVPDLAKGTAILGNTPSAYNQVWNLPTDPQRITGKEWIEIFAAEMNCKPEYGILPAWMLKAAGIFVPMMAELAEMLYQYDRDYYFDSSKFNKAFNFTPVSNRQAVTESIADLQSQKSDV